MARQGMADMPSRGIAHFMESRKQKEKEREGDGAFHAFKGTLSNLTSSPRANLLKILPLPTMDWG